MRKNYNLFQIKKLIKNNASKICMSVFLMSGISLNAQTTYTFTNAGATGRLGPSQTQVNAAYLATNLNGLVATTTATSGIQTFTIPTGVTSLTIEAWGAEGGLVGTNIGGKGARMKGTFTVVPGNVLNIVVGQQGLFQQTNNCNGAGGGGGSFVYLPSAVQPMIVAGGGGGCHRDIGPGTDGTVTTSAGTSANVSGTTGIGGTGGGAGLCGTGWPGAGGAGWNTAGGNGCLWSGQPTEGGYSQFSWLGGLRNPATTQASQGQDGSFGGGGAAFHGAGGGGGYSGGGGGGSCNVSAFLLGGGGGSYNAGTNPSNSSGVKTGHGLVVITTGCSIAAIPTNTTPALNQTICANSTTTLTVVGTGTINWYSTPTSTLVIATGSAYATPTLAAGNYTFHAAATNTCGEGPRAPISVLVNASPTVSAVSNASLICNGQTATLTASGANTYTWNTSATTTVVAVSPSVTTSYTVTGASVNGCTNAITITQSVSACTGIDQLALSNSQFNIYPNPNKGDFTISTNSEMNLSIVNNLGQIIKVVSINASNNYKASISNLANGIYFVVGQNNNQIINTKIVVSK